MEKKRYWLKLDKDFLKSSQIKVIKNMPNGKDYIIFYLSLLLESTETVGHLRFSDTVPYNDEMLASVTDTNIDIVRSATKILINLGLMDKLDDGTLYMTQVAQMTGKESESAERVRQYRIREKQKILLQCNSNVTNSNDNKEKQITKNNIQDTDNNIQDTDNIKTINNKNIYEFVEINYGRTLSPTEYENINNWLSIFDEDILKHAVKISILNNAKTISYVNGILKNWQTAGYKSLKDIVDAEMKDFKKSDMTEEKRKELQEILDYNWLEADLSDNAEE